MDFKISFVKKWANFFKAVFSPVPAFSLFGAIVFIAVSILYKDKLEFSVLTNLLGSIFIGIAGAFIKGGYDELRGESILIKKGQSAIRNLTSIGKQVDQIRSWIASFIKKDTTTKRELEELNRHLSTTSVNIASGLADWFDIIPELRQTGEVVKNYESVIKAYIEEILKRKKELIEAGQNKEQKEELEKKIKELEKNVKELRVEQSGVFNSGLVVSPSSSASLGSMSSPVTFSNLLNKTCSVCGKQYQDDTEDLSSLLISYICPDCKKRNKF